MPDQSVECLVEGGKATAAPPLGPALGPLGINIGQVVAEINKKTAEFKGMQVPVKVTVKKDKTFTVFLLISATTCPILTPAGPKAGPKGGAAVAFPP